MVFWVALQSTSSLSAQNDTIAYRTTVVGLRQHVGSVLVHSPVLANLRQTYPLGFELDWSRMRVSREAWDFCRCTPRLGVAATLWDYDFPAVLGQGVAAVGYIEPIYHPQHRLALSLRLGMGVSYLSTPFDSLTNPGNQAYSMYVSFPLMVNAGVNYRFAQHWNLRLAANFNHVSNGGIREPNKGLNYPSASLSVDYAMHPYSFPDFGERGTRRKPEKRGRLAFAWGSAVSNDRPGGEQQFYILGLSALYGRYLGGSSALAAGTEVVHDWSLASRISRTADPDRIATRAALLGGHEFWLGRVNFGIYMGWYYLDQWDQDDRVYQRYVLTVEPFKKKHFTAGISLKTHRHVADFLDVRMGWWL
jgi:hypothetical protein